MSRRILLSLVVPGILLGVVGCKHRCNSCLDREPRPFLPPGPGSSVIGPPTGGSNIPPAGVPTTPPAPFVPNVGPSNSSPLPPGGRPGQEILLPDTLPGGPSSRSAFPPSSPSVLGAPVKPSAGQTTEPPLAPNKTATGLPGLTKVLDDVAAGGKPALEGFDSLKQAGYRSVIFLHPAGTDVSQVRDVAESRGLVLVPIETTPEKLADALDQFNRTLAERSARPVYVYADEGFRAGAVWYLHFRTVEMQSAEVAKIRAHALGLTETGTEAQAFWVAIQQYLASR